MKFSPAILVALAVGILIGGIILRAACRLFNRLVSGPQSAAAVPEPKSWIATGIIFVAVFADLIVGTYIEFVAGRTLTSMLAYALVKPLVMTTLLMVMLPTKLGKAILVMLLYYLIVLTCVAIVWVVVLSCRQFASLLVAPGR